MGHILLLPSECERADDTVIWRYMSFVKFVMMLKKRALFFARTCRFDDKWEGLRPPSCVGKDMDLYEMCDMSPEQSKLEIAKRSQIQQLGHFVSCWNMGDHESDAMWRLYSLAPNGVAVRSTVGIANKCLRRACKESCVRNAVWA